MTREPAQMQVPIVDGRTIDSHASRTPRLGAKVEFAIDALTHTGEAVGRWEGFALLVRGALPGERVQAVVTEVKRRFGRATIERVLEASPLRVEAKCRHFGSCGRCSLQHLNYPAQLDAKLELVRQALERATPGRRLPIRPMLPSPEIWGTRNKAHFVVGEARSQTVLGHFEAHSKRLVAIEECPVHHPAANAAAFAMIEAIRRHRIKPFREQTGKGTARHVVVRASSSTGQAIAMLVANTDRLPEAAAIAAETMEHAPATSGVHLNRNPVPGPVIFGTTSRVLVGDACVTERIADVDFRLSPTAFFQTSAHGARMLVREVMDAVPTDCGTVLDLYSGVGLFSLPLAKRGHKVLGIEQNPQAVEDARETARRNGISGCEFQADKIEDALKKLPGDRRFDAVILDPPRDGAPEWALRLTAHRIRPRVIVDVSCDPESLARDVALLIRLGYEVRKIQPLDMFPHTTQIEAVTVLRRAARREPQPQERDASGSRGRTSPDASRQKPRFRKRDDNRNRTK